MKAPASSSGKGQGARKVYKLHKLPTSKAPEGPKKSVKGPVRGGPATGKGEPANKRKK